MKKAKKTGVASTTPERISGGLAAICEKTAQFLASFYFQVCSQRLLLLPN